MAGDGVGNVLSEIGLLSDRQRDELKVDEEKEEREEGKEEISFYLRSSRNLGCDLINGPSQ